MKLGEGDDELRGQLENMLELAEDIFLVHVKFQH